MPFKQNAKSEMLFQIKENMCKNTWKQAEKAGRSTKKFAHTQKHHHGWTSTCNHEQQAPPSPLPLSIKWEWFSLCFLLETVAEHACLSMDVEKKTINSFITVIISTPFFQLSILHIASLTEFVWINFLFYL